MDIKNVSVLGVGTIGFQIAQLAAQSGYNVTVRDIDEKIIQAGENNVKIGLKKHYVDKGKMTQEEADAIAGRMSWTTDLKKAVENADIVVEAVFENMEVKKNLYKEVESFVRPDTILASNSSVLSITEIASLCKKKDRAVGTHFSNPVQVMKMVEVAKGANTADETIKTTKEFLESLGRVPIVIKDVPGLITSRMFIVMVNEAAKMVYEGVATVEEVDKAIKLGLNHPMGPLMATDLNVEIAYNGLKYLQQELGEEYRPCPMIKRMITAGHVGRKAGKGFYDYEKKGTTY